MGAFLLGNEWIRTSFSCFPLSALGTFFPFEFERLTTGNCFMNFYSYFISFKTCGGPNSALGLGKAFSVGSCVSFLFICFLLDQNSFCPSTANTTGKYGITHSKEPTTKGHFNSVYLKKKNSGHKNFASAPNTLYFWRLFLKVNISLIIRGTRFLKTVHLSL